VCEEAKEIFINNHFKNGKRGFRGRLESSPLKLTAN
jgi:hypothetical protein